jgi:hypothetical protein
VNRNVDGNPRTCFDGVDVFDWELETLERELFVECMERKRVWNKLMIIDKWRRVREGSYDERRVKVLKFD